jgi:hypothetical protein
MLKRTSFLGVFALAMLVLAPAAHAATHVYVQIGPPAPVVVAPMPPPAPVGYVWQPGYHVWTGAAYVWTPGVWVRPPHPHAVWVAPRWVHNRHGYYMVSGHWRH